jgi:hypothetical protein
VVLGDSSVLAERIAESAAMLPVRRRLSEVWLLLLWILCVTLCVGMTSGVRLLGERGCRTGAWVDDAPCATATGSVVVLTVTSVVVERTLDKDSSTIGRGLKVWPGALIDRSCRGGRPGMVAISDEESAIIKESKPSRELT